MMLKSNCSVSISDPTNTQKTESAEKPRFCFAARFQAGAVTFHPARFVAELMVLMLEEYTKQ